MKERLQKECDTWGELGALEEAVRACIRENQPAEARGLVSQHGREGLLELAKLELKKKQTEPFSPLSYLGIPLIWEFKTAILFAVDGLFHFLHHPLRHQSTLGSFSPLDSFAHSYEQQTPSMVYHALESVREWSLGESSGEATTPLDERLKELLDVLNRTNLRAYQRRAESMGGWEANYGAECLLKACLMTDSNFELSLTSAWCRKALEHANRAIWFLGESEGSLWQRERMVAYWLDVEGELRRRDG